MPIVPSTWNTELPVSAQQLNLDLYTYDGSYGGLNGIAFHARRPIVYEALITAGTLPTATGGTFSNLGSAVQGRGLNIFDSQALVTSGQDGPANNAYYRPGGIAVKASAGGVYSSGLSAGNVNRIGPLYGSTGVAGGASGEGDTAAATGYSWVCPANVTSVTVYAGGGGGGGNGGGYSGYGGAGGGGGAYASGSIDTTPGNTYVFYYGDGGNGGPGDSSYDSLAADNGAGSYVSGDSATFVNAGGGTGGSAPDSEHPCDWGEGGTGVGNLSVVDGSHGGNSANGGYVGGGAGGGGGGLNNGIGGSTTSRTFGAPGGNGGSGGWGATAGGGPGGHPGQNGSDGAGYFGGGGGGGGGSIDLGDGFYGGGGGAGWISWSWNNASSNVSASAGGWALMWNFADAAAFGSTSSAVGPAWYNSVSALVSFGGPVQGNTGTFTAFFVLDLLPASQLYYPAVDLYDSTGDTNIVHATGDASGFTPRFGSVWVGVQNSGATVAALPSPQTSWTAATQVSSSGLSSTIQDTLNFLNYPPMFRTYQQLSTSIPNTTVTAVPLAAISSANGDVDSYSAWKGATSTYTVPISGVYLAHAMVEWSINSTGNRQCGLIINGTDYYGPNYKAATSGSAGTSSTFTRLLDLEAGDTVQVFAYQTSGGSLALPGGTGWQRLVLTWLGSLGTPSQNWDPPDTSFRWAAGTPGDQLPAQFTTHIGNDLSFLMQRPYLLSYQAAAQTGFSQNTYHPVTMDTVAGLIHGSTGDNYGGWSSANHWYVAPVPGWYLVVGEVSLTVPTSTSTCAVGGCVYCPTSGGVAGVNSPDGFTYYFPPTAGGSHPPAATIIGIYYLQTGEYIYPGVIGENYASGSFGTSVTNFNSTFGVIWLSE